MVYQYIAYNAKGEMVRGKLPAASEDAAAELLSYAGYRTVNLKPFVPFLSSDWLTAQLFPLKPQEIILFYRQLALLLESGINIVGGLELLRGQTTNRTMKKVLGEVVADIRGGHQLSAAMAKHPTIFPPISCRSLSIGEQTGNLETMLRQMADYQEKEMAASKSIKGALTLPAITAVVAIIVIGVMVTFVLPAFAGLYGSLGAELPMLTRVLLDGSAKLREYGLHIIVGIGAVVGAAYAYTRTVDGRFRLDKFILSMPLMGHINLLNLLSRCCRSISLLFTAGLPLTEIMPLVIQGTNNKAMAKALVDVQQDMLKGEGLSQPMSKNPLFLPMMVQMVKVGEETGNLDATLLAVAKTYETETEDRTRSLIALIQPAMTLAIAVVVGVIALSLVSAMYSMYGQM
ncbi:MAG: type II secretion system F family protein [Dehalococcoidales bacterium]|nr:type II secretion system F family protein [Dehalococcoidales bacterium]